MKLTDETKIAIRQAAQNLTGCGVPETALARMLADHAIGLLETQRPEWFEAPERTPEVVLRAMLAAYERAALDAHEAFARGGSERPLTILDACLGELRSALVWLRVRGIEPAPGGREICLRTNHGAEWVTLVTLRFDYEARLRGDTPLDAPPAAER